MDDLDGKATSCRSETCTMLERVHGLALLEPPLPCSRTVMLVPVPLSPRLAELTAALELSASERATTGLRRASSPRHASTQERASHFVSRSARGES